MQAYKIDYFVDDNGEIHIQLPPDAPRGSVTITVERLAAPNDQPELTPEEEAALDAELEELMKPENLRGLGWTGSELAKSPEIGVWRDREDMRDSAEYVLKMRRETNQRRLNRD